MKTLLVATSVLAAAGSAFAQTTPTVEGVHHSRRIRFIVSGCIDDHASFVIQSDRASWLHQNPNSARPGEHPACSQRNTTLQVEEIKPGMLPASVKTTSWEPTWTGLSFNGFPASAGERFALPFEASPFESVLGRHPRIVAIDMPRGRGKIVKYGCAESDHTPYCWVEVWDGAAGPDNYTISFDVAVED